MSLVSSLFSLGPRIRKSDGTLVAATGWRFGLLSLGTMLRRVVVDARSQTVEIHTRYAWLFARTRTIRFSNIRAVTYGYGDWSPDGLFAFAHDAVDVYTTGLRLYNDREVGLFHFVGNGAFVNDGPFPDWCYWPDFALDIMGTQGQESRLFVDLLSAILGVEVRPPASS
jgi:hypothetical protein